MNAIALVVLQRVREEKAESTKNVALAMLLFPMRSLIQFMSYAPRSQTLQRGDPAQDVLESKAAGTRASNNDN